VTTPFHAVIQILDQGLGWRGDESTEERVLQLERALELAGLKLGEAVPLIAEMLNLPVAAKYPPLMFAPDQKRRRLLANLAEGAQCRSAAANSNCAGGSALGRSLDA
jgi:hypothetical protein